MDQENQTWQEACTELSKYCRVMCWFSHMTNVNSFILVYINLNSTSQHDSNVSLFVQTEYPHRGRKWYQGLSYVYFFIIRGKMLNLTLCGTMCNYQLQLTALFSFIYFSEIIICVTGLQSTRCSSSYMELFCRKQIVMINIIFIVVSTAFIVFHQYLMRVLIGRPYLLDMTTEDYWDDNHSYVFSITVHSKFFEQVIHKLFCSTV